MKIGFVGLNSDVMFVLYENRNQWYQVKLPHETIISLMWECFPWVMKKSIPYHFTDTYQLAKWLYNYGGYSNGDTYIFNDLNPNRFFQCENGIRISMPKHITYVACK